jgi:hypothetical protein
VAGEIACRRPIPFPFRRHFVSLLNHVPDHLTNPARVQLQLTTHVIDDPNLDMQGLRFIKVWIGTLTSDWIDIPGTCWVALQTGSGRGSERAR